MRVSPLVEKTHWVRFRKGRRGIIQGTEACAPCAQGSCAACGRDGSAQGAAPWVTPSCHVSSGGARAGPRVPPKPSRTLNQEYC